MDELEQANVFFADDSKKLIFAYFSNSLDSIATFWNILKSNHASAFLSPDLHIHFKRTLENLFTPDIIYDTTRTAIEGYTRSNGNLACFEREERKQKHIHPTLKVMLSTSGTTGSPKFVKLSEENLLQNALSIIDYLPINEKDVAPLNLPIYYSYGLSVLTSNSLAGGTVLCTNDDILSKNFWDVFERYGCTTFAGVPLTYEMLNRIGFTKKQFPSLRYFTQAGGRLNESIKKIFYDYSLDAHILFYVMYGQTEATARISYVDPKRLGEKMSSIGKPIKNGVLSIDPETGELIYEGPNVFGGYAVRPEDLTTFSNDRRLKTGDIGARDSDGYFSITGRLKRFVKLGGVRMNLDEIELLLKNQYTGSTFVCLGLQDRLLLVGTTDPAIDKGTVIAFLRDQMALHASLIQFVHLESIPFTMNKKVDYAAITQQYDH